MKKIQMRELRREDGLILNVSFSSYGLKHTRDEFGRPLYREEWDRPYEYRFHEKPEDPYIRDDENNPLYLREGATPEQVEEYNLFQSKRNAEKEMRQKKLALILQERYNSDLAK